MSAARCRSFLTGCRRAKAALSPRRGAISCLSRDLARIVVESGRRRRSRHLSFLLGQATSRSRNCMTPSSRRCSSTTIRSPRSGRSVPTTRPTILLDPSRTFRDFGDIAFTPLDEIVAETVAYYREHGVQGGYTHLRHDRRDHDEAPDHRRRRLPRLEPGRALSAAAVTKFSSSTISPPASARSLPELPGLSVVEGTIADRDLVDARLRPVCPDPCHPQRRRLQGPAGLARGRGTNVTARSMSSMPRGAPGSAGSSISRPLCAMAGRSAFRSRSMHPTRPFTSYGISKTAGEAYLAISDLPLDSLRLANISGPRLAIGPIPTFYKRLKAGQAASAPMRCAIFSTWRIFSSHGHRARRRCARRDLQRLDRRGSYDQRDFRRGRRPSGIDSGRAGAGRAVRRRRCAGSRARPDAHRRRFWDGGRGSALPRRSPACCAGTTPMAYLRSTVISSRQAGARHDLAQRHDAVELCGSQHPRRRRRRLCRQRAGSPAARSRAAPPVIVDNLLSADIGNVPEHPAVDFVLGSIADDRILAALAATISIMSFTSPAITATSPRSTIRSPITKTIRSRR